MKFLWSKVFKKQYTKLPEKIQNKFQERVHLFVLNECDVVLNNHKLSGVYNDYRSINVTGDFRAVYRKINNETVYWYAIGTHVQLYR